jgi:hypothetical protein
MENVKNCVSHINILSSKKPIDIVFITILDQFLIFHIAAICEPIV